jgi:hypothetical protein
MIYTFLETTIGKLLTIQFGLQYSKTNGKDYTMHTLRNLNS